MTTTNTQSNDMPNYPKIADGIRGIADSLKSIADEVEKIGISIVPPPPLPPPPIQPPVITKQTPLLTEARIALLKGLQSANAPDWINLKTIADATTQQYDDNGRAAAIIYKMTGDKSYAASAYKWLMVILSNDGYINSNDAREYLIEFPLIYYWIKDTLTADEISACEAGLLKWANFALGINQSNPNFGGFRNSDSDLAVGQYFGLAVMDGLGIGPGNFLEQNAGGSSPTPIGGLNATAADFSTTRNSIKLFVEKLAAGGTWFESCQYNSNTVVLLLMGWAAMLDIHGQDYFPEIAAWIPDACDAVLTSFAPDFGARLEWGDDERPDSMDYYKQIPYVAALQDAAMRVGKTQQAAKVGALLDKLRSLYTGNVIRQRLYYFLRNDIQSQQYYDGVGPIANYSPGVGMFSRWDNNSLFAAFAYSRLGVDHEVECIADLQWYANGEWVLRHPIVYESNGSTAIGNNAILVSGLSAMWNRGPIACISEKDFAYFVGQTSGKYYGPDKSGDPPSWCDELTRTVLYLPSINTIVVCDRINATYPNPTDVANLYFKPETDAINGEKAKGLGYCHQVIWHMPIVPTINPFGTNGVAINWQTAKGQKVEISSFSPTGLLKTDILDEFKSGLITTQKQAAQQVRVHFDTDRQFDTLLSCVRLNPNAPISPITQPGVAGFNIGDTSILLGTDQSSRLFDPTKAISNGKTYLAGCLGNSLVIAK